MLAEKKKKSLFIPILFFAMYSFMIGKKNKKIKYQKGKKARNEARDRINNKWKEST